MNSLPCIKDLASSQGFDVGLLYDSYKSFLHQRSGFEPGFECRYTIKHMNSLPTSKTWLQARVLMLGYCTTVISLPCLKDLDSSQGFNVGIQSKYVQSSMHQRPGFKPGF